jgi:ankyrin repeat protein
MQAMETTVYVFQRSFFSVLPQFGCTPLHRAASAGQAEVCELLIEEGATVDAVDKTGQTPLMLATICNDKQVLFSSFLIKGKP